MKYTINNATGVQENTASALVVFVNKDKQVVGANLCADQQSYVEQVIKNADFAGGPAEVLCDHAFFGCAHNQAFAKLVLVGLGDSEKLTLTKLQETAVAVYAQIKSSVEFANLLVGGALTKQQLSIFALALFNASYSFDTFKTDSKPAKLTSVNFETAEENATEIAFAHATFVGQSTTRDLGNMPANHCYPESIADQAIALAEEFSDCLSVEVLDQDTMKEMGMGCFLSVSQGSDREGKLVTFTYTGPGATNTENPICLVGKGVTFDSGGISIKPSAGMEEMKFDMGGAAAVFGTIRALCEAKLPIQVIGSMACAENMVSARATRPGDVVTSLSGKTVEILNTDAEGRLVLADTLTYVEKFNPSVVIDMATLTGACVVALAHVRSAFYTQNDSLAQELAQASAQVHDRVWQMPLDEEYSVMLKSPIADIQNLGGRWGGSITAACFLQEFAKNYTWAHIDIAGTAWEMGPKRNATGRPVPMLMQYLRNQA